MINPITLFESGRISDKKQSAAKKTEAQDEISFSSIFDKTEKKTEKQAEKDQPGGVEMAQAAGQTLPNGMLHRQEQSQDPQETDQAGRSKVDSEASQPAAVLPVQKNLQTAAAIVQTMPDLTTELAADGADLAINLPTAVTAERVEVLAGKTDLLPESTEKLTPLPEITTSQPAGEITAASLQKADNAIDTEVKVSAAIIPAALKTAEVTLPAAANSEEAISPASKKTGDRGRHLGQTARAADVENMETPVSAGRRTEFSWKLGTTDDKTNAGEHRGSDKAEKLPVQEVLIPSEAAPKIPEPAVTVQTIAQVQDVAAETKTTESNPASQVADQVAEAVKNQRFELKMKLQPEGLGQLTVKMAFESGKLTLHIMADTPQAQNILTQQMGELKAALQVQNVVVDRMNVSLSNQQQSLWSNGNFRNYQGQGHGQQNENRFLRQQLPTAISAIDAVNNPPAYQMANSHSFLNYRI